MFNGGLLELPDFSGVEFVGTESFGLPGLIVLSVIVVFVVGAFQS
jgi:hypothetical protein